MDVEEKRRRVGDYTWYHTVDLGDGVVTPGQFDHRPLLRHYGIPDDLTGKSVLDVGPAHGFFAFEFEARGADRVVTVELPRWSAHDGTKMLKEEFDRKRLDVNTESYLHGALEFAIAARGSKVEQSFSNVYDLSPETTGMFDLVFCASVLLHVSDPLRALDAIRCVTRETALIATTIDTAYRGRSARARFVGSPLGPTFWEPNFSCLERWAIAAGFARRTGVCFFRFTILTLRPPKILSRKNHPGSGSVPAQPERVRSAPVPGRCNVAKRTGDRLQKAHRRLDIAVAGDGHAPPPARGQPESQRDSVPKSSSCRVCEATLGHRPQIIFNRNAVAAFLAAMRRNLVEVGKHFFRFTQGSSPLATLG